MKKTSEEIQSGYRKRLIIPEFCEEDITFYSPSGLKVACGYIRVVIGDRGPYIEFSDEMMGSSPDIYIPHEQKWRIKNPLCFYVEWRTNDENYIKIYEQKRTVKYADYQTGLWYISPFDLISDKYPILIH